MEGNNLFAIKEVEHKGGGIVTIVKNTVKAAFGYLKSSDKITPDPSDHLWVVPKKSKSKRLIPKLWRRK